VLRLGGNSVDRVTFDPHGAGLTPGVVAPPDLQRLAAFAEAVDWQIIYGTPFLFSTAEQVRDEAVAATAVLGSRLDSFELCNEPDLYVLNAAAKPVAGSPALFNARWTSFAEAIRSALPAAILCGPSTCFITLAKQNTAAFATTHAGAFSMLTQHYYRGFGFGEQTIDLLLGPDPDLETGLEIVRTAAAAGGLPYRLAETNSFASGGQPGVSNTFASALWGADLCFKAAARGAAGVNIHNSGAGLGYPAIVTVAGVVTQIRPLFYGLLLVAAAGTGPMPPLHVAGAPTGDGAPLRVHAVQPSETALRVTLINTGTEAVTVDLDAGRSVSAASVVRMTGPGLAATTDVSLAGTTVAIDGSWVPGATEVAPFSGRQVTLAVPAASALLATITVAAAPPSTTTTSTPPTSTTTASTTPTSTTPTSTTTAGTAADGPATAGVATDTATPARAVTAAPPFTG